MYNHETKHNNFEIHANETRQTIIVELAAYLIVVSDLFRKIPESSDATFM